MSIGRIVAGGDPYAVGRALGAAARGPIREVLPRIGRYRALRALWSGTERVRSLEGSARAGFPRLVREIEGMADGAGVAFADLFLWNCRGDLPGGGDQTRAAASGCTTVMVPAGAGEPALIAHNEDDQAELDGYCLLAEIAPDEGPAITSFYSPGLLPGHTFGVNACGLVQTINHVRPADQKVGVPRHLVSRAVLESRTLDAALALLRRTDRAAGFHHNLGHVDGPRLLSVEAPASGCVVREVGAPCAHANHLLDPRPADLAQTVTESSARRQARAEALIGAGVLDRGGPLAVLGDTADADWPVRRRSVGGPDGGFTLATGLFAIRPSGVEWAVYADSLERPEHAGRVGAGAGEEIPVL